MLKAEIINQSPAVPAPHKMLMPGGAWFPLDDPDPERILTDVMCKAAVLPPDEPFLVQIAGSPFCVKCSGTIDLGSATAQMRDLASCFVQAIEKARPLFDREQAAYFDEFLAGLREAGLEDT